MPSEQEKFYESLNIATWLPQKIIRDIRDWLKLFGAIAMMITGLVCYPFWISFWWAIGGMNMEQEQTNEYIARASRPYVVDLRSCDYQRISGLAIDRPMNRSYRRATMNLEALCRFLAPNPHPDLSAAPVLSMWVMPDDTMDGHIVGMCPGVRRVGSTTLPHCSDPNDRVPAVSRFGGLTDGQQRAVKLLESTLSNEFWLRVASANGVADTAAVRAAARNSRTFNDEFNK